MNTYDKIKAFCRPTRMIVGAALIVAGLITDIAWFYLGAIPFIAGLVNFCPLCMITKKCSI